MVAGSSPAGGANTEPTTYTRAIGEILSFRLWMQREGYRPATTRCAAEASKSLSRRVDLFDTDAVKTHLARANVSEGRKERLSNDLARFYRYKGIQFEKPRYRKIEKLPFIPMESEVTQLISAMGQKTGTFLQLLRETGIRCGEAWNLKWIDLDSERGTVNVVPEKNSKPRQLKVSNRLVAMLNRLPRKPVYLFREANQDPNTSLHGARRNFERQRKRLAVKLQNPRLMQIHFHSLRHFKATMKETVQLEVKDVISRTEDQVSHEINAPNKQLDLRLLDRYRKREQSKDVFFKKHESEIKVMLSDFPTRMPRYRKSISSAPSPY